MSYDSIHSVRQFTYVMVFILMTAVNYNTFAQFVVTNNTMSGTGSLTNAIGLAVSSADNGNNATVLFMVSGLVQVSGQLPPIDNMDGSVTLDVHPQAVGPQGLEFASGFSGTSEALHIENAANTQVTIRDLEFRNFVNARAVQVDEAGLVSIIGCHFQANGTGVDADYAQLLSITGNNIFVDNSVFAINYQNGLPAAAQSSVEIIGNTILNTTTVSTGIAIDIDRADAGSFLISGNSITIIGIDNYAIDFRNKLINAQIDPLIEVSIQGNTLSSFNNLHLGNPIPVWNVLDNEFIGSSGFAGPSGIDITITSTAGSQDNIYGIHFIETPQIFFEQFNNIKNDFNNSDAPLAFLVDGFFRKGVRVIGYNGTLNSGVSIPYVSSNLVGRIKVINGIRTTIRANIIGSSADEPIILANDGNDNIAAPQNVEAKFCGSLVSIKYELPVHPFDVNGLKQANGEFEVDFYKANADGELIHHLGSHHIISLPNLTPFVHTKVIALGSVPGSPGISSSDRVAVTVTSLGTGSILDQIGTSEAGFDDIEDCPVPFFTAQDVCFVTPNLATPLVNQSCAPPGSVYIWNFGDQTFPITNAGQAPSHIYTAAGTYTITLVITAPGSSCSNSYSLGVEVVLPPTATFTTSSTLTGKPITFTPDDASLVTYAWDFGDGTSSTDVSPTHVYFTPAQYSVILTVTNSTGCTSQHTEVLNVVDDISCCVTGIPVPGIDIGNEVKELGKFYLDKSTGQIVYRKFNCPALYPFTCLSGQRVTDPIQVVSASVVTFNDNWKYREEVYHPKNIYTKDPNAYETGEKGKWRPERQYVYREKLDELALASTNTTDYKNDDRGTFPMVMYNWKNEEVNDNNKWVLTSTTTKYTPNGEPIEDENILGIKSTAKYGYNHTLPVLVAQNAAENSVAYESFENLYESDGFFENNLVYDATKGVSLENTTTAWESQTAHTGNNSIKLLSMSANSAFPIAKMQVSDQLKSEGLLIRLWLQVNPRRDELVDPDQMQDKIHIVTASGGLVWSVVKYNMRKVSNAGQWTLYETILEPNDLFTFSVGDELNLGLHVDFAGYIEGDIYLDDVRVQPLLSEMVCYVYDSSQRLVAVFDDQHYAMIYEYNQEGVLVRKLKETVEGIKTISETQYNTVGENRP